MVVVPVVVDGARGRRRVYIRARRVGIQKVVGVVVVVIVDDARARARGAGDVRDG